MVNRTTAAVADFPPDAVPVWQQRGWEVLVSSYADTAPHVGDVIGFTANGWGPVTPPATTVSHFGRAVRAATTDAMRTIAQASDVTIAVLPTQVFVLPPDTNPSVLANWIEMPFASDQDYSTLQGGFADVQATVTALQGVITALTTPVEATVNVLSNGISGGSVTPVTANAFAARTPTARFAITANKLVVTGKGLYLMDGRMNWTLGTTARSFFEVQVASTGEKSRANISLDDAGAPIGLFRIVGDNDTETLALSAFHSESAPRDIRGTFSVTRIGN